MLYYKGKSATLRYIKCHFSSCNSTFYQMDKKSFVFEGSIIDFFILIHRIKATGACTTHFT